jgi:hypothetical protein
MRPDRNGIVRTEWPTGSQADGANKSPEAVDGRAQYGRAPERRADKASVVSVESRVAEWTDRLQDLVDDEIEGGGDPPSEVELIAEAAGMLQRAVDVALSSLEHSVEKAAAEAALKAADTIAVLREEVQRLQSARRLDAERHRRTVDRLAERLKEQEGELAAKVDKIKDALTLMEAEAAEARSVDRLRTSSWHKRHRALVQQRLVQRDLTKGNLQ